MYIKLNICTLHCTVPVTLNTSEYGDVVFSLYIPQPASTVHGEYSTWGVQYMASTEHGEVHGEYSTW